MGMFDWIAKKAVSSVIDDTFREIEESGEKYGIDINFEGEDDVAEFAVDVNNSIEEKGGKIEPRIGTSLQKTFQKAVSYSITASQECKIKDEIKEAKESGNDDLVDELEDKLDDLEEELEDLEEDILNDYRELEENLDIEAVHVQRNYDGNGNLIGVEVEVEIENTNNGKKLEMETEIEVNSGRPTAMNISFDN